MSLLDNFFLLSVFVVSGVLSFFSYKNIVDVGVRIQQR